jgi:uncharacterized membrane protein YkvA (DUF1232 family)
MSQNPEKKIVKSEGGFINELMIRIKLVFRLMGDSRVNLLYKTIPVASLVYLVLPTDLIPLIPVDDALVVWLATYLFVELAPPDVVQEHLNELRRVVQIGWEDLPDQPAADQSANDDVVDAEFKEIQD